jgi:hypothetical protein
MAEKVEFRNVEVASNPQGFKHMFVFLKLFKGSFKRSQSFRCVYGILSQIKEVQDCTCGANEGNR